MFQTYTKRCIRERPGEQTWGSGEPVLAVHALSLLHDESRWERRKIRGKWLEKIKKRPRESCQTPDRHRSCHLIPLNRTRRRNHQCREHVGRYTERIRALDLRRGRCRWAWHDRRGAKVARQAQLTPRLTGVLTNQKKATQWNWRVIKSRGGILL